MNNQDKTVLVVDDVKSNRKLVVAILKREFGSILEAENGYQALEILEKNSQIHLIILDLIMPVMDGLEFLILFNKRNLSIPVLICSGNEDISLAVDAMKLGAKDYVEKPFEHHVLLKRVQNILSEANLKSQNTILQKKLHESREPFYLLGASPAMNRILLMVEKLANSSSTVLISGESGTGKEVVAKALHYKGSRGRDPFVIIDCATINSNMVESELFGYEKGAFNGAMDSKHGLLNSGGDGTLFFDEITGLSLEMQAKILRVLQDKQIRAVGASGYKMLNSRMLVATNKDLQEEVRNGNFREDLFYRLNIVNIHIPPLRERKEDIAILAEHFLNIHAEGGRKYHLAPDVIKQIKQYDWPGNVRELENAIQRALALAEDEEIHAEMILPQSSFAPTAPLKEYQDDLDVQTLAHYEKIAIEKALKYTAGNRRMAAEMIGIGEATLYRKIKEYQIQL
jgi:DNA-binding NtrC family response regulator